LQFVVSARYVEVPLTLTSIEYDVIDELPSAGAVNEIFTPPVVESIDVVTVLILEGTVVAATVSVDEYELHP
jgi:hypothetical protein